MKPRFVVLEGLDGCGKSTQAERLCRALKELGRNVVHLREPGATPLGERIRSVLLDPASSDIGLTTEAILYSACRSQMVRARVTPALKAGQDVVCERYFYSTLAYQGHAGGEDLEALWSLSRYATGGLLPDRVVVLDLEVDRALERLKGTPDRIEGRGAAYFEKVRRGFLDLAHEDPDRFRVVDASQSLDSVAHATLQAVQDLLA
ncbi:MAG: dTMP kinase [Planctomycetota bacterium]